MVVSVARNSNAGNDTKTCRGRRRTATARDPAPLHDPSREKARGEMLCGADILSASPFQNRKDGLVQNSQIEPETPVLDIFQIEPQIALERRIIAGGDLP